MLALGMPLTRDADGSSPRPDLDPLDSAPAHAQRVAQALSGFEYEEFPAPSGHADCEQLIKSLTTASDIAVLIVHVVGHGELAEGSSEKLYLLGHDGEPLQDPVSSWIERIEAHPNRHRPVTLFILDVCCAGEAAVTAWHARMDVAKRRAWVLAAAGRRDRAFGYRLSRALVQVLDRYLRGERRIDPSVRYIPANTLWKEVEATVLELVAQEDGMSQSVLTSLVPSHADLSTLPFFPNPGFAEDDPEERLPPEIARLADLAVDPLHFMRRAGGAEPIQRDWREGYFSGRNEDLSRLSSWLDDDAAGPALCVVTGKPGAGKSALIGMLVCAALPDLREFTKPLWRGRADTVPGTNDRLVVIHARHMSFDDIGRALSAQVRRLVTLAPQPSSAATAFGEDSTASLFALLEEQQQSEHPITIIIDALDESNEPETIIDALLYPLKGLVRLLIATRKDTRVNVLLTARNGYEILDLDTTIPQALCEDLLVYVKRLLAAAGPYTSSPMRQAGNALAEAIATRLADTGDEPDTLTPEYEYLRLGEFLTAGIYVNFMLANTEHSSLIEEAARTGHAVPRSLPDLLEMDLQRHGNQSLLRAVLTAVAFAQGQSMPEHVLADVVAFDPTGQGGKVPLKTLYRLLDNEARLYLSRRVDEDGSTLYRLFHQDVADWWRNRASDEDRMQLYEGLVASVRRDGHSRPLWHLATPYLQRHLPQHAADAGCLDRVLEDADYLVFADPSVLLKLLPHVVEPLGEQAEANAADYAHAFAERTSMPLAARRQLLAMSAALSKNRPLQETLERSMGWTVRWAVRASSPPTALAAFTLQDHPYAATGNELGHVEVWDVHSGEAVARSATRRGRRAREASEVRALTVADSVSRLRIVTGGDDDMRIWDPLTGALVHKLPGYVGSTRTMTTVQLASRCHLLVGGYGGFSVWDLAARKQTGELVYHGAWVDALATTHIHGRLSVVTGADNGRIQVWDLLAGEVVRDVTGQVGGVRALAVTHLDGRPCAVSAGEGGIVYLWDLESGCQSELTDHQGDAVTGLTVVGLPGRPYAVTGHESGRTALWDLTTKACSATFHLPAAVTAVATSSDGTILVTSADGIAALTPDTLSGEPVGPEPLDNPEGPSPCR
ncbi:NACHT and WD repeat domain-containing protein [Streptomyces pilosus]|uniref:NACHT and WD repeat domain-containing protein n=1 Tax=Streptomyces pilosus TaxID=28893 RepID=UPI0036402F68